MSYMSIPDSAAERVLQRLAVEAAEQLDEITASDLVTRAEHLLPQAWAVLRTLYDARADVLINDLASDLIAFAAARRPELRELDRRRADNPLWFQDSAMIGYVCYVDRFAGTLRGVGKHLDHLRRFGVRYLHLMPLLTPRAGESDGGYAVVDYDEVNPKLGSMTDLTELADELHRRDTALCVDLALNHTAREHPWAQSAMSGDAEHRDFYLVFPDRIEPDKYERTLPDIFPQLAPGSFTFVPELDAWVWTTFREFQWDLNYRNPAVFRAMFQTMMTLTNRGPDVLRLDAVPFLWKQQGTDCQNRPQTHLLLQAWRALVSVVAPGVLLKAEAMVAPEILARYLGAHPDGVRNECHLAYDNQLMVMLWSMLATGESDLARRALTQRPAAPPSTSWVTYARCHDDIGWAVSDEDARAVGLDGASHRALLSRTFAGAATRWSSLGEVFQAGSASAPPTSGMTAALTGLQAARVAGDEEAISLALARIEALYSIVFSFGGIPLIYMGDEVGLGNDPEWDQDPEQHGDNRWMHRPKMDWGFDLSDPRSVESRLADRFAALAEARATLAPLGAGVPSTVLSLPDTSAFGYLRGPINGQSVTAVVDVGGEGCAINMAELAEFRVTHSGLGGAQLKRDSLTLPSYGFAWLVS